MVLEIRDELKKGCERCNASRADGIVGCLVCNQSIRLCDKCYEEMEFKPILEHKNLKIPLTCNCKQRMIK